MWPVDAVHHVPTTFDCMVCPVHLTIAHRLRTREEGRKEKESNQQQKKRAELE